MKKEDYKRITVNGAPAYILREGVENLRKVSTLLFDCDGVLIDARDSYNRSISRTVSYLANKLLKTSLPEKYISDSLLFNFRKSGGFNNDWDTSFAILLYLFTRLPKETLTKYEKLNLILQDSKSSELIERITKAKKLLQDAKKSDENPQIIIRGLNMLAKKADKRGLASMEEMLLRKHLKEASKGFYKLMLYPERIGVSTVSTVFEEMFLGPELFNRKYGVKPIFLNNGPGLIANEEPIATDSTLTTFTETFGKNCLGIVSGRSYVTAQFTLGDKLKMFSKNLTVFIEDEITLALDKGDYEIIKKIGKPNPYGLLKAEKNAPKNGKILYIGDSKEDIIMVKQANKSINRFISAGVYGCSHQQKDIVDLFIESGVYLITKSVNDFDRLLETIAGGEK